MLLGLGSSHRDTVSEVRGHEYRGPLSAMRDYLAAYEAAPYRGPEPHGRRRWCWPPCGPACWRWRPPRPMAPSPTWCPKPTWLAPARAWMRRPRSRQAAPRAGRQPACLRRPMLVAARARTPLPRPLPGVAELPQQPARGGLRDDDLAKPGSDRLVDALVAWGDDDTLRARLRAMLAAGADQVAMIPLMRRGPARGPRHDGSPRPPW